MFCLDTNIVIDFFRNEPDICKKVEELPEELLCTSAIVVSELFKGAFVSRNPEKSVQEVENYVDVCEFIDFDDNSCRIFGKRYTELQKLGKMTQELDLMIASICIAHNTTLVTRNGKDFKNIRGLKVIEW